MLNTRIKEVNTELRKYGNPEQEEPWKIKIWSLVMLMATITLFLGVTACQALGLGGAGVQLVKDGKPMAEIVLAKDAIPATKLAATDFQKHIKLISGAELPIVDKPGEKTAVYIGDSEFTRKLGVSLDDIKNSGYKVIVKDNYVVLAGRDLQGPPIPMTPEQWQKFAGEKYARLFTGPGEYVSKLGISFQDDTGSLYATSDLLEQIGVRWYMPYENGTVIPDLKDISVKNQDIKKESSYKVRYSSFYGPFGEKSGQLSYIDTVLWLKHLKYGSAVELDRNPHGVSDILGGVSKNAIKAQLQEHPEYFAMYDGKVLNEETGGKPRLTNPEFRKSTINYLNKFIEACPGVSTVWLGMPDGFGVMDENDAKLFPSPKERGAKFSAYVWDYWLWAAAELKKTHPDKYVGVLSYTTYAEPPPGLEKVPENIMLYFMNVTCYMAQPNTKAYFTELRDRWLKLFSPGTKLQTAEHFLFYTSYRFPRYPVFFTKLLQEEMQKVEGVAECRFIESESICPGLNHMTNYWQGKLLWDPYMDRKAMLDEYYTLYYGPAKTEMKEFYEFAESVWMRPEPHVISPTKGFLNEGDVNRYFQLLAAAREKAGKDSVYDKRIAMIEDEMQTLKTLFPGMKRMGPTLVGSRVKDTEPPFTLDGDLSKPFWNGNNVVKYKMRDLVTGDAITSNPTTVMLRMSRDWSKLFIGVECNERHMDKLFAKVVDRDNLDIFNDDAIEIYIETPERSSFKIAVNPNGAVYDEGRDAYILARDTQAVLWNPEVKAATKKLKDRWTAEIVIPTEDFGKTLPSKQQPWGINVCRERFTGGGEESTAISPTGKTVFDDLTKLANIWFE